MDILTVIANTAAGVFAVDSEQRIIFWNKGAGRLLGFTAKEALGRSCHEVIRRGTRMAAPSASRTAVVCAPPAGGSLSPRSISSWMLKAGLAG